MNNINLMPRVPRERKLFLPLLLTSGALMIFTALASIMYDRFSSQKIELQREEVQQLNASVQALFQQKMPDPLTIDYKQFETEVQKLKSARTNWQPVLELLVSQLPEVSRLTNVEVSQAASSAGTPQSSQPAAAASAVQSGQSVLKVKGEFAGLVPISEYVLRIQQSALVESVVIKSVERVTEPMPVTMKPFAGSNAIADVTGDTNANANAAAKPKVNENANTDTPAKGNANTGTNTNANANNNTNANPIAAPNLNANGDVNANTNPDTNANSATTGKAPGEGNIEGVKQGNSTTAQPDGISGPDRFTVQLEIKLKPQASEK